MHTIDYIIIFIYLGMIILAGFIGLKKAKFLYAVFPPL